MALPIQSAPKYTISLPSDGKEVKFRPFLVKEQKLLMLAQEENDEGKTMEAIKDLIRTVTFQEVEPDTLPIIDMEYLFLKIRAKSVGETANIKLTCNDASCPDESRGTGETVVNIDEVEVVLCDWILFIPAIISLGPPQYPNLQPVIQYVFETPFKVKMRFFNLGSTEANV